MGRTIGIIAALEATGEKAVLLRDSIAACGHRPLRIDVGVLGEPTSPAEVGWGEVASGGRWRA